MTVVLAFCAIYNERNVVLNRAFKVPDENAITNSKSALTVAEERGDRYDSSIEYILGLKFWFDPYWLCASEKSGATSRRTLILQIVFCHLTRYESIRNRINY